MQLKKKKYGYIFIANITFTVLLFCIIRLGKDTFPSQKVASFTNRSMFTHFVTTLLRCLFLFCLNSYFMHIVDIFCSCLYCYFIDLFIMFDIYVHKYIPVLGVSTPEDLHVQRRTDNPAYQSYESSNSFVNSL